MAKLSVILITKNEAENIGACLQSVAFADEIVVVDGASRDGTAEIAQRFGARVVQDPHWPGFGPQKNRALELATGDWVLALDADERVPPELAAEIKALIDQPESMKAYAMPRSSYYCGRWMKHSGWWPDHVTRLFRRGAARFSDDLVHERLIVDGAVGRLKHPLQHYSFRSYEQVLDKINRYSTAGAEQRFRRGKRAGLRTAIVHGLWTFIRTYFLRLGVLDGREGFILAVSNAEGAYYRYLKLMRMSEQDRRAD